MPGGNEWVQEKEQSKNNLSKSAQAARAIQLAQSGRSESEQIETFHAPPPVSIKKKLPNTDQIADYFREKAKKDKKTGLTDYFDKLSQAQKEFAILTMVGGKEDQVTLVNVKKNMKSGFLFRSINWDKFSEICRQAAKRSTDNPFADSKTDYASYAVSGGGAGVSGVAGGATVAKTFGAVQAGSISTQLAPVSSGFGIAGAAAQLALTFQHYDESLDTVEKANVIGGEGMTAVADAARTGAQTMDTSQQLAGAGASVAATAAAGIAGVVGGTFYLTSGLVGAKTAHDRAKKLDEIESRGMEHNDPQMVKTAQLAKSTARMNVSKQSATALKGALMIAGGALLLALGTNPIGWTLLGIAGIVAGVAGLSKMWKKATRKTEVVDRHLDIDEKYKTLDEQTRGGGNGNPKLPSKEEFRLQVLAENGYNNVNQCYNEILMNMAEMAHRKGVIEKDPEYIELIESLGLKIDYVKRTPNPDLIAKKIHN